MDIEGQLNQYISEINTIINILEDVLEYLPQYTKGINSSKIQKQIGDVIKDFKETKNKLDLK